MSNDETLSSHEREYIKKIPLIPPKQAFILLEQKGYRGQELARRALCLAAYRHIKRIKRIYLENIDRETLPPKNNILLIKSIIAFTCAL